MTRSPPTSRTMLILVSGAILVVLVLIVAGRIMAGPGPMDFASGARVDLASYPSPSPTGVPPELADADQVTRGKYLATAADCVACHTAKGGRPFAGGLAFNLPFGTIYAPNITPDRETGIGDWTDEEFLNAVHQGIGRDGTRLYPAFPYTSFTLLSDADVLAIKAYLFSLPPARNLVPATTLSFPYNQRWLMAIWSYLFNTSGRYRPNLDQSPEWNRGAYLAEGLAHCGECHTPRNLLQAVDNRRKYAGAVAAGWRAYNITGDKPTGIADWSDADLAQYLSSGHADGHGTSSGPMAEAVDLSLRNLTPGDIHALVVYLRSIPGIPSPDTPPLRTVAAPDTPTPDTAGTDPLGQKIFEGACIGCHSWSGAGTLTPYATLTAARAVNDPSANNITQIVLSGTRRQSLGSTVFMPAFGNDYSDTEIAAVANYVTARFGAAPSNITSEAIAGLRQQSSK
jgi:mono/diheme cytochrome c family protein